MHDEIAKLQLQLDRLNDDFQYAQRTIQKLERRSKWRPPNVLVLIVSVTALGLGVNWWSAKASSEVGNRSVGFDTPPTKVKAPFEVDDDNGNPIMIVMDQAPGNNPRFPRGVYVMDQNKKNVVRLMSTDDDGGGGSIMVTEAGPGITSTGGQVNGIEITGTKEKTGLKILRGGKTVASMSAEQSDKNGAESGGSIQIFNAGEKPTATLTTGKNGGQLSIYDAKNKKSATLGAETGSGMLNIYGSGDKPRVTVGADSDGGTINIFGSGEKAVATLESNGGDGKLSIGGKEGDPVVEAVANQSGGYVKVMKKGDEKTYTSINSVDAGNGLKVRKAGVDVVFVGEGSEGGTVENYNAAGDMVNSMGTIGGKGLIAVWSGKHAIAFMTESDKHPGGGNFTAANPAGQGIFSAGFTGEGADVCIDRKSSLRCLGINLPLSINP